MPFERSGDLATAVTSATRDASEGRRRPALARVRELRPVPQLRAARGGVREAGAEAHPVKERPDGQLEQRLLVLVTLGLVAFGLVMVFSATSASAALGAGDPMTFLVKQGAYALVGLTLLVSRLPLRLPPAPRARSDAPARRALPLHRGARRRASGQRRARWFLLGPISVQPSELAKVAVCVWACALLARRPTPRSMGELLKPLGIVVGIFCVLVLLEPDLGTTIALCLMVGGILVVSNVPAPAAPARRHALAPPRGGGDLHGAVPPRAFLQLPRPVAGPAGRRLPDRAGDHRHGLRRHHRRGPRPGDLEDLLPPRGAHGHDLRDRRRGARADRLDAA